MTTSAVRIALIYPELLGTYGDGGNALVLAQRLVWRGLAVESVTVPAGTPVPSGCDIYLMGGGEDEPQTLAADGLRVGSGLTDAVAGGAVVLAVCAGFQIAGRSFPGHDGVMTDGLGLLDVETRRSFPDQVTPLPRAVGDIAVRTPFGVLVGYENHGGRTRISSGSPLGDVLVGVGNGDGSGKEGCVDGKVLGTYLHGPLLAQNPHFADHLLSLVVGSLPSLDREDPGMVLHAARIHSLGVKVA